MFIDPNKLIPVTDGTNTIYIRSRMDYGAYARVESELSAFQMNLKQVEAYAKKGGKKGKRNGTAPTEDIKVTAQVTKSAQELALLKENVKKWEGPAFQDGSGRPIPCSRENVARLDPNDPLVMRVLETIDELNTPATEAPEEFEIEEGPDPNPDDDTSMEYATVG